ncbi:MAG: hypothetical protein J3Q66DRAFT_374446 [Benniella sp.]|nr:MAG: hypothetical protein J3Q66DRAFT_374446 [Benniella sp.]
MDATEEAQSLVIPVHIFVSHLKDPPLLSGYRLTIVLVRWSKEATKKSQSWIVHMKASETPLIRTGTINDWASSVASIDPSSITIDREWSYYHREHHREANINRSPIGMATGEKVSGRQIDVAGIEKLSGRQNDVVDIEEVSCHQIGLIGIEEVAGRQGLPVAKQSKMNCYTGLSHAQSMR